MQTYLQKFNEQYKGKQSVEIEIFNEDPLTIKYARYNQSGEVCYCMADSNQASQKAKNGWQKINCDIFNCEYRQKNELGKCACNRIGWLKFIIPSVCKDRIFLMRITGQTSINRLDEYFYLQKTQGESLKGQYVLFLKKEEQSNSLGKTFNNYILDILKKEDFNSQKIIQENIEKSKELSTINDKNVNNEFKNPITDLQKTEVIKEVGKSIEKEETSNEKKETKTTKKTSTKTAKAKTKKNEDSKEKIKNQEEKQDYNAEDVFKDCYSLLETYHKNMVGKDYLIAKVVDMEDKIYDVAIRPQDAIELEQCDLGTVVKLNLSEVKGQLFAVKFEFLDKMLKKVAA